MFAVWTKAQYFWRNGQKPIPKPEFFKINRADLVLKTKLAFAKGASIYVRGSRDRFQWLIDRQESGRKGGTVSSQKRVSRVVSPEQKRLENSARYAVHVALRSGKITKPNTCSECDSSYRLHAHHTDYNKALDVTWLCPRCHARNHREIIQAKLKLSSSYTEPSNTNTNTNTNTSINPPTPFKNEEGKRVINKFIQQGIGNKNLEVSYEDESQNPDIPF